MRGTYMAEAARTSERMSSASSARAGRISVMGAGSWKRCDLPVRERVEGLALGPLAAASVWPAPAVEGREEGDAAGGLRDKEVGLVGVAAWVRPRRVSRV